MTWTTRLRSNAALHDLPPAPTGRKGRPRKKGDRLPRLAKIAAGAAFSRVTVTRYGKTETIAVYAFTCLWYSVTGTAPVTVILIRDKSNGMRPRARHHREGPGRRPGHREICREMGH